MVAAICEVTLALHDVFSLKEKRSIVRSVVQRTRNRHPISIAEVDELDNLALAVVGFALVSNDRRYVNSLVDKIVAFIDELGLARVEDHSYEIITY